MAMFVTPEQIQTIFLIGKMTGIKEGQKTAFDTLDNFAADMPTEFAVFSAHVRAHLELVMERYEPMIRSIATTLPDDIGGIVSRDIDELGLTKPKQVPGKPGRPGT